MGSKTLCAFPALICGWLLVCVPAAHTQDPFHSQPYPFADEEHFELGEVIDDRAIAGHLSYFGTRLLEHAQAVPFCTLREQLDRKTCKLNLPRRSRWKMSSTRLLRKHRCSILVLGHLYKCSECGRHHVQTDTGFLITTSGAFVTTYHGLQSTNVETVVAMTGDGRICQVTEVLAADKAHDVAILQLLGDDFTPLPLGAELPAGSPIRVISHPDHDYFSLTEGQISRYAVQSLREGERTTMAITADFARGSSGAPVLDERGQVVGLVASTRSIYYNQKDDRNDNLQMVVKLCIPVRYVRQLIVP